MRVVLMQPYFFPYIGYFQLLAASDRFVIYDDAQYIKGGWVNRNRILIGSSDRWITMPVAASSHRFPILKREYLLRDRLAVQLLSRISGAYRNAPYFDQTMPLVKELLAFPHPNVAAFNINLIRAVASQIGIDTPIMRSSEMVKNDTLVGGENRVIDICSRLGTTMYINPIGGLKLYSRKAFAQRGIELRFLSCQAEPYRQFGQPFVPSLSIIDVLMFNDVFAVRQMLGQYSLLLGGN